ncbi:signal peptidase II [Fictibacillus aquaticus]|uniref:Lipoprotein signal peptidase n=1 Tax=Fictibacillus aquaticus TaxID=2021314 RepID=A0A235FDR9_9BACL|nr:signal peptidase II [Fictibacillus aquaticus]OYD58925.1 signal peptidase II [Fictibacillus aquaticus]
MVYYLLALAVFVIDHLTKWWIVKSMQLGESIPVIQNFFYITSHRNRGAAFGILQNQRWFFIIITTVVVAAVIYFIAKKEGDKLFKTSLGLILGGALGNFADRLFRGEVVDFLDFYIGSYDFPIFNIADSALVVGVGLVFIHSMLEGKKEKQNG